MPKQFNTPHISIILPAYNEAACLPEVIEELSKVDFGPCIDVELIVVNDGSTDESRTVLERLQKRHHNLRVLTLSSHRGKTTALQTGVEAAQGAIIATLDADGEDDPTYLPEMISALESGVDLVCAKRLGRRHPFHKRALSAIFNLVVRATLRIDLNDINSGLKVGRQEVWRSTPFKRDFHRFVPVFAKHNGYRTAEVEVIHRARIAGSSKYRCDRYVRTTIDLAIVCLVVHCNSLRGASLKLRSAMQRVIPRPVRSKPIAVAILTLFLLLLVPYLSALQLMDHYGFRTELHDLGIMEQSIWQITQGNLDMPTSYPEIGLSRLARHRNLIFYLLAPLYAVVPSSETLLLLTPLSLALACVLLFKAALQLKVSPFVACAFAMSLGVNSFIHNLLLYDFRADTLAPPLLVGLFYSVHTRRLRSTLLCVAMLLMVKEDMAFTVAALAPWVAWRWSCRVGLTIFAFAAGYWLLAWKALPLLMNFSTDSPFWFRFNYLGTTPEQAIVNILTDPSLALAQVTSSRAFTYLIAMAIQTGGLGFISPFFLIGAAPSMLLNALDKSNWQNQLGGVYYSGIPTTIIYLAALEGYWWLTSHRGTLFRTLGTALVTLFFGQVVILGYYLAPTPISPNVTWQDYHVDRSLTEAFQEVAKGIPNDATIATQNNLAPHLMPRHIVVELKPAIERLPVDYVLFGIFPPASRHHQLLDHGIATKLGYSTEGLIEMGGKALNSKDFGLVQQSGPFFLLQRGQDPSKNATALPLLEEAKGRFSRVAASPCQYEECSWPVIKVADLARPIISKEARSGSITTK
jgi:uncharacterized membrane protein/glycosyltransferase involved in cell wall biosynthesis